MNVNAEVAMTVNRIASWEFANRIQAQAEVQRAD